MPPSRHPEPPVADRLFTEPYTFDYFQAVRLLARLEEDRKQVGHEGPAARECVRFQAVPSLAFPPSAITQLKPNEDPDCPPLMTVAFLGLYGPTGVLPRVYTELIMERIRAGDRTLAAFLDLFNHRMTSFFYRAWEKYRPAIGRERGEADDHFADTLFAVMGLGIPMLRDRHAFPDTALLAASGLFAQRRRPAVALEAILGDYFRQVITIASFVGRWLRLDPEDRSMTSSHGLGRNNQLGVSLVVGSRVWDETSKFRITVGPVSLAEFRSFLPGTVAYQQLCQMTRLFVDSEFDFDVQIVLRASDVPPCRIDSTSAEAPQLGRTAWLISRPFTRDSEDAVFAAEC